MTSTTRYEYDQNGASNGQQTPAENSIPLSDGPQSSSRPSDTSSEPADSVLNTSTDSNDDDAHGDAQLLSASILATIQSTPRHHATPPARATPTSTHKSSTPLNGRHDSYDDGDYKDNYRRNGKTTNNNMYPPSPTANITPRRRSTRVVKSAKPFPLINEREKSREKEKEKEKRGADTPSTKRDSKSVSGSGAKRARKRIAAANEADVPQPVPVLGRNLDLTTLLRTGEAESSETSEMLSDPNWAESISLYSLARAWMCSGVDLDPFHILRHDTAESVLADMHDYISPPALPPPSTSAPPALPERPRYPSSNDESFQAALKKGCDNTPKTLLRSYVSNCKTFRTWWKANYTQRLSKYKGRLAVLFPASEQNQGQNSLPPTPSRPSTTPSATTPSTQPHPRTPSPPPRHPHQAQPHRTPSPPPRQLAQRLQEASSHPPTRSQTPPPQPTPPHDESQNQPPEHAPDHPMPPPEPAQQISQPAQQQPQDPSQSQLPPDSHAPPESQNSHAPQATAT